MINPCGRLSFAWFVGFVIEKCGGAPFAVRHDEVPGRGLFERLFRAQKIRRVELCAGNLRFVIKHQQPVILVAHLCDGSIDPEPACGGKQIVDGAAFPILNTTGIEEIAVKLAAPALERCHIFRIMIIVEQGICISGYDRGGNPVTNSEEIAGCWILRLASDRRSRGGGRARALSASHQTAAAHNQERR